MIRHSMAVAPRRTSPGFHVEMNILIRLGQLIAWFLEYVVAPAFIPILERNLIPDFVVRPIVRLMLRNRIRETRTAAGKDAVAQAEYM